MYGVTCATCRQEPVISLNITTVIPILGHECCINFRNSLESSACLPVVGLCHAPVSMQIGLKAFHRDVIDPRYVYATSVF